MVTLNAIAHKFKMIENKAGAVLPKPPVKDFEAYKKYCKSKFKVECQKRFFLISVYHNKVFAEGDPLRKLKL